MAAAFVASALGGNGQTVAVTSITITIPASAAVGNVAVLSVELTGTGTVTTPTGWTLRRGPDAGTSSETYLYTKTLASGDPGAVVTIGESVSGRIIAAMRVYSGVTETGIIVAANAGEASTSTPTLPSATSVPAGAAIDISFNRRTGATPAITVTVPSGYTAASTATTSYGSIPELTIQGGYKFATTAGTYGGEASTSSGPSVGSNYVVILPAPASGAVISQATVFVGDSVTEGQGASTKANRWLDKLVPLLRTRLGFAAGGAGFIPAFYDVYAADSPWGNSFITAATGTNFHDNWEGPGFRVLDMSAGDSITYTLTGTSVDLWYYQNVSGVGTLTVTVDGTVATTINTVGATESDQRKWISLGASGAHTIKIDNAVATSGLLGFTVYNGDESGAYVPIDAGHTGIETGQWLSTTGYARFRSSLVGLSVTTACVELGANDFLHNTGTPAQVQTNLTTIMNDLKTTLGAGLRLICIIPDLRLSSPAAGQTQTWVTYRASIKAAAVAVGAEVLDLAEMYTTNSDFSTDLVHPSDSGHAKIANAVLAQIMGDRSGSAKVWNATSSAWVKHPLKVWSGTAWAVHPAKAWNGSSWLAGK